MSGQHSEDPSGPALERSGLDRSKARRNRSMSMRLKSRVKIHVLDDDSFPALHRLSTGRAIIHANQAEIVERVLLESPLRDDLQCSDLRVIKLDVSEVRLGRPDSAL